MRFLIELRVEREVVAAGMHQRLHFANRDTQLFRQLFGRRNVIALRDRRADRFLEAVHQICALRREPERTALFRQRVQNRLADPPDGVGDEFDVLFGIVLLGRMHQADVALIDQIEEQHVLISISLRVVNDESQVRLDQLLDRTLVVLLRATAELFFTLRSEFGDTRDFLQILIQEIVRLVSFLVAHHA